MNHRALAIAEHLHLDVPAAGDEALQVDARVAEAAPASAAASSSGGGQILEPLDALHAAPAAAAHRLDQQRRADRARPARHRLVDRFHRTARHDRHVGRLGLGARAQLVADRFDLRGGRADEDDAFATRTGCASAARSDRNP